MSCLPWIVTAIALAWFGYQCRCNRRDFEARFPPISDEEFLARCTPGTRRHVALGVRRIVAQQLGVEYERIYPESSFVNDLGAD